MVFFMLKQIIMEDLQDCLLPGKILQIHIGQTDEIFNKVAAQTLCDTITKLIASGIDTPNLTLARGNTQTGIYQLISQTPDMLSILSRARFFQLDEILDAPKSFRDFTEAEILRAVFDGNIPPDRWHYFDTSMSPEEACDAMRSKLTLYGGLHIAFLGLGAENDDHYALVRGGISVDADIISPELSEGIRNSYKGYLGKDQTRSTSVPTHGLSLAHGAMPDHIIISAKGAGKADPVFNMLCTNRDPNEAPDISTTFLRDRENVTLILDRDAAEKIKHERALLPARSEIFEYTQ